MLRVYSSAATGQGAMISASVERPQSSLWLGDAATFVVTQIQKAGEDCWVQRLLFSDSEDIKAS